MAKILSEKGAAVLAYVQEHATEQPTAATIAEALGMEKKSVNGTLTALSRDLKNHVPLIQRVEIEGQKDKVITLTDAGKSFDVNAEVPEDAE